MVGCICIITFIMLMGVSCKKFVTVGPPKTETVTPVIFGNNASATAAMVDVYAKMGDQQHSTLTMITLYSGLTGDEFISDSYQYAPYHTNSLTTLTEPGQYLWTDFYSYIYQANAVLEGLQKSTAVSVEIKNQLRGEALFIRAFCHFYLVNFYGNAPLITTTDYKANALASRTPVSQVYEQMIADLKEAVNLLSAEYVTPGRVRPNKYTAAALLSRVYLYTKDWNNAVAQADTIIQQTDTYQLLSDLNAVFLLNSPEAIWQLHPVGNQMNTTDAPLFIIDPARYPYSKLSMSRYLLASFESGDLRKTAWTNNIMIDTQLLYYPFKYKANYGSWVLTEGTIAFRLAEQYLIRAEARTQLNDLPGAISDVDSIRNRAGLPLLSSTNPGISKSDLLLAVEHERQTELFMETGHRWMDLKRTGRADAVLGVKKSPYWQTTDQLYPIPLSQIQSDPNMSNDQNPGY